MKRLTMLIACVLSIGWAQAQVSNNNEDEVYKMVNPRQASMDFVPGEVLVKMKDASPVKVRRAKGKFQNTDNKTLDAVLAEFGIEEMEQVLPGEKRRTNLRRAKAPNGGFIEAHDLSQLYRIFMFPDAKVRRMAQICNTNGTPSLSASQMAQKWHANGTLSLAKTPYICSENIL